MPLEAVGEKDYSLVGGKGYTLGRLLQAGFNVPPGFVVTTTAYRASAAANDWVQTDAPPAPIPSVVARAILSAYQDLGQGAVAVRSSALGEDARTTSFAGQYETVLDVVGDTALLQAVRCCWDSLQGERALAYSGGQAAAMAVVVQRMVPATRAGVAFTADPVSGRSDVVVVEAVAGSCAALVGGEATPHRYIVPKAQNHRCVGNDLLSSKHLATVTALAQTVEKWAGVPYDLEWAIDEAEAVHLLQARPITASGQELTHWTRDNVGEVIPEPVTPLSWSVLKPLGNVAFAGVLRRLGDYVTVAELFGRFYGRVYLNQTLFQQVMARFYPSQAGWRGIPRLMKAGLRLLWLFLRLPQEANCLIANLRSTPAPRSDVPAKELLAEAVVWREREAVVMETHLIVSVIGTLLCQVLEKAVGPADAVMLLGRPARARRTGHEYALDQLARQIAADERLRMQIMTIAPDQWRKRLAETETGQAVLGELQHFLDRYGHYALQEFELGAPRWRDDPTLVLSALQSRVRTLGAAESEPASLGIGPSPTPFCLHPAALLARAARRFTALREELKASFVLAHSYLRSLYLALGKAMAAAEALEEPSAIFFLAHDELADWIEGRLSPQETSARVTARRAEWEVEQQHTAPFALAQRPDGQILAQERDLALKEGGLLLCGIPASPGVFAGRARVARSLAEAAALEPGEVLVVPAVTPGWAPLLRVAGALVTEIGGILSHGAIIAREYGLPAVLNVTDATRHVRTTQLILVDGSKGTVRLHESADHEY